VYLSHHGRAGQGKPSNITLTGQKLLVDGGSPPLMLFHTLQELKVFDSRDETLSLNGHRGLGVSRLYLLPFTSD